MQRALALRGEAWAVRQPANCPERRRRPGYRAGVLAGRVASTMARFRSLTESKSPVPVAVTQTETGERPSTHEAHPHVPVWLSLNLFPHQLTIR